MGRGNGEEVVGSHRLLPVPAAGAGASGRKAASDWRARAGLDAPRQQAPRACEAGDVHGNRAADHDPTP